MKALLLDCYQKAVDSSMSYPPGFLEEIRMRIPVSSVVGKKLRLTKKGREFVGLSPFKMEKTPSFTVNDDKQFYHCFATGEHGDIFSFLMATEGLSFPESVEQLAGEAGLDVPKQSRAERVKEQKKVGLLDIVEAATQYFAEALWSAQGREALATLKSRGLSEQTIRAFRLGFADDTGKGLLQNLKAAGVADEALIDSGLFRKYDGRSGLVAFFRDRLMFPITDRRGRAIAFGGRFMGDAKAAGVGKYINSPDTPLFDKGRVLYNLDKARQAAHDGHTILVAEGYMDVIALCQAGFLGAVAPLGTALTEHQLTEIWRMHKEPVLCFDGDEAGKKAAFRAADRAISNIKAGFSLRFLFLPSGEDPDSLIQTQGAPAFKTLLETPDPLDHVLWQRELGQAPVVTPEQKADLEARLFALVDQMPDERVQKHYRRGFSDRLWRHLRPQKGKSGGKQGRSSPYQKGPEGAWAPEMAPLGAALKKQGAKLSRRKQEIFLACLINHPLLMDRYEDELIQQEFEADLDKLRQEFQKVWSANADLDIADIKPHLMASGMGQTLDNVLNKQNYQLARQASPDASDLEAARLLDDILGWKYFDESVEEIKQKDGLKAAVSEVTEEAKLMAKINAIIANAKRLERDHDE